MSDSRRIDHATVFATPDLPLRVVRLADHGAAPIQHSHSFHELVLILSGLGTHAVGDETYRLGAGDVFVVLGDTTHGYPQTRRLSLINILYDPTHLGIPVVDLGALPGYHALFTVEPQVRRQQKFTSRLRLHMQQLAHATELVAHMEEELSEQRRGYKFMAVARLMELIGYLSRCYSRLELEELPLEGLPAPVPEPEVGVAVLGQGLCGALVLAVGELLLEHDQVVAVLRREGGAQQRSSEEVVHRNLLRGGPS